jgi:hypothetical protein
MQDLAQSIDPARYPTFLITRSGGMLNVMELASLVVELDDEIETIQRSPEAIFVEHGTDATVLDVWNDLTSLREEINRAMIWRLFDVSR